MDKHGLEPTKDDQENAAKRSQTQIDASDSEGLINQPSGPVTQNNVNTQGGDYSAGNIDKRSGTFNTVSASDDAVVGDKTTTIVGDIHDVSGEVNIAGRNVIKHDNRQINTGGGAYIEGEVKTGGGDFVGHDQTQAAGLSAEEIDQLFAAFYAAIEARPNTSQLDQADLKSELQEVQSEVAKGGKADENLLARRLRNLGRMAPDILEVVLATLANPAAGLALVVRQVAEKMKETAAE